MDKRAWSFLGGIALATSALPYGCGGDSKGTGIAADGGIDATSDTGGGHDTGAGADAITPDTGGGDTGASADSGGDVTVADGAADSSSSDGPGGDGAGGDGASTDGPGADAPSDAPAFDGNIACTGTNTACTYDSDAGATGHGVCVSDVCSACLQDTDCSTGYGAGHICLAGSCVPGNCHTSADCADGGSVSVCVGNMCSSCDSVTGGAYYVDPVNGSNATGSTGSDKAGGQTAAACAFKSITYALSVIGAPATATTITVLTNDPASNETFPLIIPANVTVKGSTNAVNVSVAATMTTDAGVVAADGFVLGAANSGVESLTVTGLTGAADGIRAGTGSAASTELTNVTVTGFATGDGVLVSGTSSILTLHAGVVLTANLNGLHVSDTGTVVSTNTDQTNPDVFRANTNDGILVDGHGTVTLTGTAGTLGAGSIVATANTAAGCALLPAQNSGNEPLSALTGFVAWANGAAGAGDGLHLEGGAHVKVRSSYLGANGAGVRVTASTVTANLNSSDTSGIDLGAVGDFGLNTLQSPTGAASDAGVSAQNGAGLCVTILPNQSQQLVAKGNIWANSLGTMSLDCSTVTTGALSILNTCAGDVDLGGQGFNSGSKLSVYVEGCTCSLGGFTCQ